MSQPRDSTRRRMWFGLFLARAGSEFALSGALHVTLMIGGLFILVGGSSLPGPGNGVPAEFNGRAQSVGFEGIVEGGGDGGVPIAAAVSYQVSVHHLPAKAHDFAPGFEETGGELALSDDDRGLPGGAEALQGVPGRRGQGTGEGEGDSDGDGRGGRPGGDTFFGVQAAGKKIVYVVDCSGSMLAPHFSADKTRFQRLKREMHRSIDALPRDREFFVIFFSDTSFPMPARSLQPASKDHKKKFLDWVDTVPADGNTDPADALRYALRLKPDTIFLLTDGSFSPKTAKLLIALNRDRVTINALGFGEESNADLLKGIAKAHGGTYQFIP